MFTQSSRELPVLFVAEKPGATSAKSISTMDFWRAGTISVDRGLAVRGGKLVQNLVEMIERPENSQRSSRATLPRLVHQLPLPHDLWTCALRVYARPGVSANAA